MAASYLPKAQAASIDAETLFEFVTKITPTFTSPRHLAEIAEALEQAMAASRGDADPIFVCSSIPPQHGKTETYLHGIAYWLHKQPGDFLAYLSYNADQAEAKSRKAREYVGLADIPLRDDTRSVKVWRTLAGGGLMVGGIPGGSVTGKEALKCLIIDDPFKERADAESRVKRDAKWDFFRSSVWTRLHQGTSVFVNATRWHTDDLHGRIEKDPELSKLFRFINFPVIVSGCDPKYGDGFDVLWPEGQPKDLIKRKRAGTSDYEWNSLYMGEPRPRDTQLFQGVSFYQKLPNRVRYAIGVDLAYTSKTSSDWSVAVVMASDSSQYYVVDVVRRQCAAPDFAADLKAIAARYPGAPMLWHGSGTERGVCDFMQREGVRLGFKPATTDKFQRATPFSAAWNRGDVHVREGAPWVSEFTGCLLDFTGKNDPHDDDVDAASSAFDQINHAGADVLPIVSRDSIRQQVRDELRGPMGGARSHRHAQDYRRRGR